MSIRFGHDREIQLPSFKNIQIDIGVKVKDPDYFIQGDLGKDDVATFNDLLSCIFVNPDKRYKLVYEKFIVLPSNYDEDEGGIIDMVNKKILKTCSYNKNIVSFCLYGNNKMYLKGALVNLEQYTKKYPGIKCYFYTRSDVPDEYIKKLEDKGGVVVQCVNAMNWFMMFTRFFPAENTENWLYLSRDTDCRLGQREVQAIMQWFYSRKRFHIMRDHPWHNTRILGGMWGMRNMSIPNIRLMIMDWAKTYYMQNPEKDKGPDQYFLNNIYRCVSGEIYVNDEFFNYERPVYAIEAPRDNKEYIGEAFDEDGVFDQTLRDVIR
tara:strand:- start:189 stop:1151 length:963 start_codon:yes stop_codon:yes gene_type:complete